MFAISDTLTGHGEPRQRASRSTGRSRSRRTFRPDLGDCLLEDRLTPIVPNLGVIVLTTGGYVLMTPFPGAFVPPSGAMGGPGSGSAPGVSGTPVNLPFFIIGAGGISSAMPGNITGFPSLMLGGPAGSMSGAGAVVSVGSGANDAFAPVIPIVTRNTIANDRLNPQPLIGGQPSSSSSLIPPPPAPAPAASAPPASGTSGGPTMPPPGSSLKGPFVPWPSAFPRLGPPGFPMGFSPGAAPGGGPTAITPPPPPGSGQGGSR